jgi:hypothetical protein
MDDRDHGANPNSANGTPNAEGLPYYLPPGEPPLTEKEIAAGIEYSPITGLPGFKARSGQPMITHQEVRKLYEENFP